jgi:hypothetical protein
MAKSIEIDYYNTFILKKVSLNENLYGVWPNLLPAKTLTSSNSITYFPGDAATSGNELETNFYVEEARIRGGYNNTFTDYGVKAYITETNDEQSVLKNSLIYSGIYNSRTGVNNTNQFSIGEDITRSLNPANGSIQKLYSTNTNLNVFQENKSSYALIDKDTIYTTEGGTQTGTARTVIGQVVPYSGEYGISKNPESFAFYGRRMYFADINRNAIIRLSMDGVTEINRYGMFDYFRDEFAKISEEPQRYIVNCITRSGTGSTFVVTNNVDKIEYGMLIEQGGVTPVDLQATVTGIAYDTPTAGKCTITASQSITVTNNTNFVKFAKDLVEGGWDIHNKNYIVSSQQGVPDSSLPVHSSTTATLTTAGTSYTANNNITTTGGTGSGLAVDIISVGGSGNITSFIISDSGSGYSKNDVLTITGGGTPATITLSTIGSSLTLDYNTLAFEEDVKGWTSFYSYNPAQIDSLKNKFYTFKNGAIWEHYDEQNANNRSTFYNVNYPASITFLFNNNPQVTKSFHTVSYEGSSGWQVDSFKSDLTGFDYKYYVPGGFLERQDTTKAVLSYLGGRYETANPNNVGTAAVTPPFEYAGFNRKENRYVASVKNNTVARPEEVIFGPSISGIKGFFVEVKVSTDNVTQVGGMKELFSVSSDWTTSST